MPFDPTKPAASAPLSSSEMREQLNALKALIDAVPAGPPGPAGPEGPAFANIQIGSVTTVDPFTSASASVSVAGNNVELSFSIPKGETGGVSSSDVSNAIASEISGTARNPNTVADLSLSTSDPDMQAVVAKFNELLAALRR